MTPEELEACWKDPKNRKWGFYYCKADPRVVVPKRFKWMGWTINMARPSGVPVLLLIAAIAVIPALIVKTGGGEQATELLTLAASIAVVCALCAYLSSVKRWSR